MKICITGAAGHIGRIASAAFAKAGHDLVLIDREDQAGIIGIDLSRWNDRLVDIVRGSDTVVHLAGVAQPWADWAEVAEANIDGAINVATAVARAKVGRLVFASSNWVLAGHRGTGARLSAATPPAPVNAYGASKLFGERLVKHLCEAHGLEGICLRIGYSQHRADDKPGAHMAQGIWGQHMWLSHRDLAAILLLAATAALDAPLAVMNAVSDNEGMPWDIEEGRLMIGYKPTDRSFPTVTSELVQQEASVLDARRAIQAIERLLTLRRW